MSLWLYVFMSLSLSLSLCLYLVPQGFASESWQPFNFCVYTYAGAESKEIQQKHTEITLHPIKNYIQPSDVKAITVWITKRVYFP